MQFWGLVYFNSLTLNQVWPVRSRGGFCITLRWNRWQRRPRLWWRLWATSKPPSPAPPTSNTSDPCLRYYTKSIFCLRINSHLIWDGFWYIDLYTAGMDALLGCVQRGSSGLWWYWSGFSVSGGNPLCYQDSLYIQHSGNFMHWNNGGRESAEAGVMFVYIFAYGFTCCLECK